jgi:hypothetical protein
MRGQLAVIRFIERRPGHPDQGLPGEGGDEYPDQGLPGEGSDLHPDQGLPGRPGRPPRPSHPITRPPWEVPWPPGPTDPDYGVDGDPGHVAPPIYLPIDPAHPDQGLPPVAGHLPAPPEPGYIWPPLPGEPPQGKAALLVWLVGVGWRYVVVTIPPPAPAQPLPGGKK